MPGLAASDDARARIALAVWILAAPLVLALRALGGTTDEPPPLQPAWAHVVVLTVAEWPARTGAPEGPAFADLARRGVRLGPLFSPSTSSAGAAASLWTGRWPRSHGVVDSDHALSPDAWTLASAARASGARTAAFLEEPLLTVTRIGGFDTTVEDADLDDDYLIEQSTRFLREHADARTLLWIHLADAGPRGARLEGILAGLQRAHAEIGIAGAAVRAAAKEDVEPEDLTHAGQGEPLPAALDRRAETLTIVTGLRAAVEPDEADAPREPGAPPPQPALVDAAFLVPLFVELPTGLNAGTTGYPHLALTDVAGFAAELLRLSPGTPHPQSRPNALALALAGGPPVRPVELTPAPPAPTAPQAGAAEPPATPPMIIRDGPHRVTLAPDGSPLCAEELSEGFLGTALRPLPPDAAAPILEAAATFHAALERQSTPARDAKRTPSWRDWR